MASKYIINVRDFSPHKIIARGSLPCKYIINTRVFNPHKIIAGVSLAGKCIINIRAFIHHKVIVAEKLLNVAINTNKVTQHTVSGHAIEPCKSDFTRDVCVVCSAGYVQPDVISSTGDPNTTSCFKPTSACLAEGNNKELGTQSLQALFVDFDIYICLFRITTPLYRAYT